MGKFSLALVVSDPKKCCFYKAGYLGLKLSETEQGTLSLCRRGLLTSMFWLIKLLLFDEVPYSELC